MADVVNSFTRNAANIISVVRVLFVFIALSFFMSQDGSLRLTGLVLLFFAFLLDGVDGFCASRLGINSRLGGLIDIVGDRITENSLLFFLAYYRILPLVIPLIFIARSFISDFIRCLLFAYGQGAFDVHTSCWGGRLMASRLSRSLYLMLKFFVCVGGAWCYVFYESSLCQSMILAVLVCAVIATIFNIVRFGALVYDSRYILRKIFLEGDGLFNHE